MQPFYEQKKFATKKKKKAKRECFAVAPKTTFLKIEIILTPVCVL